jgi:hypothetical protein
MKAICSPRWGVPDYAARLALRIDEQLGARTEVTPPCGRIGRSARLPGAQFTGKAPEVFGVILWHADHHPAQGGRLWGSGWGLPLPGISRSSV